MKLGTSSIHQKTTTAQSTREQVTFHCLNCDRTTDFHPALILPHILKNYSFPIGTGTCINAIASYIILMCAANAVDTVAPVIDEGLTQFLAVISSRKTPLNGTCLFRAE